MDIFFPLEKLAQYLTYDLFFISKTSRLGEALDFFIYDTLKIFILLFVTIVVVDQVLGFVNDQVFDAREHDDVNILALPADFIDLEKAKGIVKIFLSTPFSAEEKYKRRLYQITCKTGRLVS